MWKSVAYDHLLGYNESTNGRETMAVHVTRAGVALTVGIIVVTGLIIGGLFWAKERGEQARRDDAIQVAEQNLEEQSNEDVALNEGETNNEEENQGTEAPAQSGNESTQSGTSNSGSPAMPAGGTTTELPQTGPGDAVSFIGAGLVTFAAIAYYRSRRALLEV